MEAGVAAREIRSVCVYCGSRVGSRPEYAALARAMGAELARRWLAALLMAPRDEREAIVSAIEQRMIEEYHADDDGDDDRPSHSARDGTA